MNEEEEKEAARTAGEWESRAGVGRGARRGTRLTMLQLFCMSGYL